MRERSSLPFLQHILDLGIGEARAGTDQGVGKTCGNRDSPAIKTDIGDHRPAVFSGAQAARAVAQCLGQHGLHGGGKIAGVAALESFAIQRAARTHIMGNVGDGHQQPPASGIAGDKDGIVKVPASSPSMVTKENERISFRPEAAAGGSAGRPLGFRQGVVGKGCGNAVVELCQIFLNAGIVFPSQRLQRRSRP